MIDKTTHGIIDYLTGALLVIAPYLFGFSTGGIEQWLAQVIGAAVIVMSLVTDYRPSIVRLIPFKVHLGIDLLAGVVLAVSPWIFGFADVIWWPHLMVGVISILVVWRTTRSPEIRSGG